jgi:selenide,water dikinase
MLAQVLRDSPLPDSDQVLVGFSTADDAAVYRLSDELALVTTVDVLTPIADDPYLFGQIAAANSLSDVFAMGGKPLTALSIVGFPSNKLGAEVLAAMLRGAIDKAREARTWIVGGHSMRDTEVKFGLSVTGTVHPDRVVRNSGARVGDVLYLTKPLGTGIVTTGVMQGLTTADAERQVMEVMTALNQGASEAMCATGVHAATDVTGFGLLGHAFEVAAGSGVTLEVDVGRLPVLEQALELARKRVLTGAHDRNLRYVGEALEIGAGVKDEEVALAADAQTSGGLLISVAEEKADELARRLAEAGCLAVAQVGRVVAKTGRLLVLR